MDRSSEINNPNGGYQRNRVILPNKPILFLCLLLLSLAIAQKCVLYIKLNDMESQIIDAVSYITKIKSDSNLTKNKKIKSSSDKLDEKTSPTVINEKYLKIINRTEWGAANSSGRLNQFNRPIDTVIIAHTKTRNCTDFVTCKFLVNMLQMFYNQFENFEDIGYNFLIGGDGAVYEGIGWKHMGHHTRNYNDHSIGIGFIGNYQYSDPTANQIYAAILLLHHGLENNYLDKNYVVKGQRDLLPTVSPGDNLYRYIMKWEHCFNKNDGVLL